MMIYDIVIKRRIRRTLTLLCGGGETQPLEQVEVEVEVEGAASSSLCPAITRLIERETI